jgi:hypothetical protein
MTYSEQEWNNKGIRLFGPNRLSWKFKCPNCKNITTPEDFRKYKDQGATPDSVYQECIGRYTGGRKGPNKCDWAAYGLFRGPDLVVALIDETEIPVFEFDEGEK